IPRVQGCRLASANGHAFTITQLTKHETDASLNFPRVFIRSVTPKTVKIRVRRKGSCKINWFIRSGNKNCTGVYRNGAATFSRASNSSPSSNFTKS
ncbi:unnamed protein product, partial [Acanthoscelides obtectus]